MFSLRLLVGFVNRERVCEIPRKPRQLQKGNRQNEKTKRVKMEGEKCRSAAEKCSLFRKANKRLFEGVVE
jgi:hypothetical protein